MLPDKQLAAQQEEAEKLKLAERMQHMSESEKDAAVQETADLKLRQVGALDSTPPVHHAPMLACCCTRNIFQKTICQAEAEIEAAFWSSLGPTSL